MTSSGIYEVSYVVHLIKQRWSSLSRPLSPPVYIKLLVGVYRREERICSSACVTGEGDRWWWLHGRVSCELVHLQRVVVALGHCWLQHTAHQQSSTHSHHISVSMLSCSPSTRCSIKQYENLKAMYFLIITVIITALNKFCTFLLGRNSHTAYWRSRQLWMCTHQGCSLGLDRLGLVSILWDPDTHLVEAFANVWHGMWQYVVMT